MRKNSAVEWIAPVLGSKAPKTNLEIRLCSMAPAHMAQGSVVTSKVQLSNRQLFFFWPAAANAKISACPIGLFVSILELKDLATSRLFHLKPKL